MNRRLARNGIVPALPAPRDGPDSAAVWWETPTGVVVTCRLTPRAGRDEIAGVESRGDGTRVVAARVRAAPEDGRANDALRALIAEALGIPVTRVVLVAGARSRIKRIAISGESRALIDRLRALPSLPPTSRRDG